MGVRRQCSVEDGGLGADPRTGSLGWRNSSTSFSLGNLMQLQNRDGGSMLA